METSLATSYDDETEVLWRSRAKEACTLAGLLAILLYVEGLGFRHRTKERAEPAFIHPTYHREGDGTVRDAIARRDL